MLKGAIIYLTIAIACRICNCERKITSEGPKIVIVGAGAAGIAAASKLFDNGFKSVTILEAEGRIGGRIHTVKLGEHLVDLGGQWVHGEKGNVAYDLAYPLGLLDKTDEPYSGLELEYFDSLGNPINEEVSKNLTNFYFKYAQELDFEDGDGNAEYESVGQYVERMFDREFKDTPIIYQQRTKYLHLFELLRMSSESAESWFDVSLTGTDQYQECSGDQMINWRRRGYSTILDVLMKRYPEDNNELPIMNNTVLNSEVIAIDYLNNAKGPPVLITTSKGDLHKADHVIVTVSLGVLKEKHKSLFIPPLPDYKRRTIEGLAFGNVAKIYLLFDVPFWTLGDRRIVFFTFAWNDDERESIELDPEKAWTLGISGAMSVEHKPNLLELWITGRYARAMEAVPEDRVRLHSVRTLRRFLGKSHAVGEPAALLRSRWSSQPHFRGTYSYRSIDSERREAYAALLEKPLDSRNLTVLFAGEATSDRRYSTVDGAIGSGWRAADRLLNLYKSSPPLDA